MATAPVDLTQVEEFFFRAMVAGWAVGGQKIRIPDLPGYKAMPFEEGDWRLLDLYCVTPHSPMSAGTTTIWFQGAPVWVMNYGGFYEQSAIPFLKRALHLAYEAHHFVGGRGPRVFVEIPLVFVYMNYPRLKDFAKFEGHEEIFSAETGDSVGFHDYSGMSLL